MSLFNIEAFGYKILDPYAQQTTLTASLGLMHTINKLLVKA